MTTKKKTAPADPLVAATTILINGKAFEAGERISGVPADEVTRAVGDRRVVKKSVFDQIAEGTPAPELTGRDAEGDEPETGEGKEPETGEGQGEGTGE